MLEIFHDSWYNILSSKNLKDNQYGKNIEQNPFSISIVLSTSSYY